MCELLFTLRATECAKNWVTYLACCSSNTNTNRLRLGMAGPFFRTPAKRNFELVENFPVTNFSTKSVDHCISVIISRWLVSKRKDCLVFYTLRNVCKIFWIMICLFVNLKIQYLLVGWFASILCCKCTWKLVDFSFGTSDRIIRIIICCLIEVFSLKLLSVT